VTGVGRAAWPVACCLWWTLWSSTERGMECNWCWCCLHRLWWPHCSCLACFTASLEWLWVHVWTTFCTLA